jgi:DNA-binding CsgD family transcriptional regulator
LIGTFANGVVIGRKANGESRLKKGAEVAEDYGVFGAIGFPCHHAHDEYGLYCLYALRDQTDLFAEMCRKVQTLHLTTLCFDSFCNLKFATPEANFNTPLAPRERECLLWVAAGLSSKRIAHKLGLSLHTVNEFISNAMRKLGATTRAEATAKAISGKLITP